MLGYYCKRSGLFKEETSKALNSFVFTFAFPTGIAMSFYKVDVLGVLNKNLLIAVVLVFTFVLAGALIIAKFMPLSTLNKTMSAVAIFRGNFVIMGFPIL